MDHLDSKNLVPFKRRGNGYRLPKLTREKEEQVIEEVDPELRPEEQGFVRHYLGYADVMLKSAESGPEAQAEPGPEAGESSPEEAPEKENSNGNSSAGEASAESEGKASARSEKASASEDNVIGMPVEEPPSKAA